MRRVLGRFRQNKKVADYIVEGVFGPTAIRARDFAQAIQRVVISLFVLVRKRSGLQIDVGVRCRETGGVIKSIGGNERTGRTMRPRRVRRGSGSLGRESVLVGRGVLEF